MKLTKADMEAVRRGDSNYLLNKGANYYMQKDFENAVGYYQLASSMGNVQALSNLGYCYLYGRSVEPNRDLAIAYFDLAVGRMWVPAISLAIFTVLINRVLRILSCLFTSIAWLQAI